MPEFRLSADGVFSVNEPQTRWFTCWTITWLSSMVWINCAPHYKGYRITLYPILQLYLMPLSLSTNLCLLPFIYFSRCRSPAFLFEIFLLSMPPACTPTSPHSSAPNRKLFLIPQMLPLWRSLLWSCLFK